MPHNSLTSLKSMLQIFVCDIDNVNDGPTTPDKELFIEPSHSLSLDVENREYRLPHPLCNRLTPQHISPISFQHLLAHPKTKIMTDTSHQSGMDWQIEED